MARQSNPPANRHVLSPRAAEDQMVSARLRIPCARDMPDHAESKKVRAGVTGRTTKLNDAPLPF